MKQAYAVVKKMVLTEKGSRLKEKENKYLFKVHPDANKVEIKDAVEKLFRVKVTKVNTMNRLGKLKRNRRMGYGMTSSWKQAVVTLKEGDKIEMT